MAASTAAVLRAPLHPPRVALIGNPNTGKTTLFNRLCGARAKTSNFPGTTTTSRVGRSLLGHLSAEIIDLPGLYELDFDSPEAKIARDIIEGKDEDKSPDALVVLVDASNLARNLVLVGELLQSDKPVVVALNMSDLARRRGLEVDVTRLASRLKSAVVETVASRGTGVEGVRRALETALSSEAALARPVDLPPHGAPVEALSEWADQVADDVTVQLPAAARTDTRTERLDRVLTHPVFGTIAFLAVMGTLFWALFALARYPMDLIEATFTFASDVVTRALPAGPLREMIANGVLGGVSGAVVFLPQICLLFFLISLLEDTGYLARAAFVNDRFFQRFGLPGQAFLPLLTSHACALPGIMSTRLISSRRDRLATIMVAPFMSCSARLPVYVLLTSLLFANRPLMAGLAFAACYMLGASAAFLSALLFGKTVLRGRARPMVLELPTYKTPSLTNALLAARDQGLGFLKTAGTVIVAIAIVMWALSAYPRAKETPEVQALHAQAAAPGLSSDQTVDLTRRADALQARAEQVHSYAGHIGRVVQPVFRPLGYDWQLTVGILTSFIAREVFVSTMNVLAGGGREKDEGVLAHIQNMKRDDGSLVFTRATAASALVFFVLAMQCLPTLVLTSREAGGVKYAALQFAYMSGVAYVAAFLVFQGLRLGGIS